MASAPENASVRYLHALVKLRLGEEAAALAAIERALQLGYPPALPPADPKLAGVRNDPRLGRAAVARPTVAQDIKLETLLSMTHR